MVQDIGIQIVGFRIDEEFPTEHQENTGPQSHKRLYQGTRRRGGMIARTRVLWVPSLVRATNKLNSIAITLSSLCALLVYHPAPPRLPLPPTTCTNNTKVLLFSPTPLLGCLPNICQQDQFTFPWTPHTRHQTYTGVIRMKPFPGPFPLAIHSHESTKSIQEIKH